MPIRLPLLMKDHVAGKRSAVTCALKCGNQCVGALCNTSDNSYFRDVASGALSRRALLGGGAAAAVAIAAAGTQGAAPATAAEAPGAAFGLKPSAPGGSKLRFDAIAPVEHTVDELTVPEGFDWHTVIRWGDRLFSDAPEFDWAKQSAEQQKRAFGCNNDYSAIQEQPGTAGKKAVMFANHEYTNEQIMLPEGTSDDDVIEIGMAAHGLSVVELERKNRTCPYSPIVDAPLNRRILLDEVFELTGPLAGSDAVKTKEDPEGRRVLGTLGNCSGGLAPWGTILSGEENFHSYFLGSASYGSNKRYGVTNTEGTARGWEKKYDRFDSRIDGYENEPNRFGYIVEVDPWDPTSTPRKHTSLGRLKHEGANIIIGEDGRAVAYTGDDEAFEYLYKFVSADRYCEGDRAHNMTLLEKGDLYVARFTGNSPAAEITGSAELPSDGAFDGSGEWIALVKDGESAVEGFTLEEVLVNTRAAADAVGATKMDRPEDVEPSLVSRKVYMACTKNSDRGAAGKAPADEANPRAKNRDGHVIEIDELRDQASQTFAWNILLVAGDPAQGDPVYFSGFPVDKVSPISCPDNVAFDSVGNLWISTDGAPGGIGYNDGLFRVTLEGEERGRVEQFLSVPREGETCGPVVHDRDESVFVSVQHPGEDGTFADQHSFFPDYNGTGPRPTVVQVLPRRGNRPDHADQKPGKGKDKPGHGKGKPGHRKGKGKENGKGQKKH